ncbi:MAG TPA: hypothetical protein VNL77_00430, partial [Roseiflexaceae bacterium]|nr:hypothetical protein [Roseiflexaceae bacterium]
RASGVLPPGGRAELELVAAGRTGPLRGELVLRSGQFTTAIPWEATARPGLPVGHRVVATLAELDLAQPEIVAALEGLARKGALQRWLRAQRTAGARRQVRAGAPAGPGGSPASFGPGAAAAENLAARLDAAVQAGDALALRLLVGALLHPLSPERYPLLALHGAPPKLTLAAGARGHLVLALENHGDAPCVLHRVPGSAWARCEGGPAVVPPGGRHDLAITLAPPPALPPGDHTARVVLRAGDLDIPLAIPVTVVAEPWWQRALRWLMA